MKTIITALLLASVFYSTQPSNATTHLVLIGGGARPRPALQLLANVAGPRNIVILPWATEEPDEAIQTMTNEFRAAGATAVVGIRFRDYSTSQLQVINNAGALFFPGGDQNVLMQRLNSAHLPNVIRRLYANGVGIGGTSAGAAVASNPMLAGNGDATATGLGLLTGAIVDQHFWVRAREPRLLQVLSRFVNQNPQLLGYGIDEGMAVYFVDNQMTSIYGSSRVSVYSHAAHLPANQWNRTDRRATMK